MRFAVLIALFSQCGVETGIDPFEPDTVAPERDARLDAPPARLLVTE